MRTLLVHNPSAGSGNIAAEDLLTALASGGTEAHYCSSKAPDFSDVLREPVDFVVVAGGDGTVMKTIDRIHERNLPIGILPLGSANNIARSLGIEADPIEIARGGWRETEVRRLDVGTAAGPWGQRLFVEAVGIGVLAEALAVVEDAEVKGTERCQLARATFRDFLTHAEPEEVTFAIDRQVVEACLLLTEIMNISSIGPRLSLAPAGDPGDGLLDLVYLEADLRTQMLGWLEAPSRSAPPLTTRRGGAVAFEWRQGRLHVDDAFPTPPASPSTICVEISSDPMTVLMPRILS
jgi:diacylglycerol kinase family enzyme